MDQTRLLVALAVIVIILAVWKSRQEPSTDTYLAGRGFRGLPTEGYVPAPVDYVSAPRTTVSSGAWGRIHDAGRVAITESVKSQVAANAGPISQALSSQIELNNFFRAKLRSAVIQVLPSSESLRAAGTLDATVDTIIGEFSPAGKWWIPFEIYNETYWKTV